MVFVHKRRLLRNLHLTEVSTVDRGAGKGVSIALIKRDAPVLTEFYKQILRKREQQQEPDMAPQSLREKVDTIIGKVAKGAVVDAFQMNSEINKLAADTYGNDKRALAKLLDGPEGGRTDQHPAQNRIHRRAVRERDRQRL